MSNGKGLFFNGIPYYAEDMVSYLGSICSDGVMMNEDSLKPVSSDGLNVHINGGTAYLKGFCYVLDDEGYDFAVESGSRTDIIVVQLDLINKTLQLVLKKDQEEPLDNEIGVARLAVDGETVTLTDIRQQATFNLPLGSNPAIIESGTYIGTGTYGEDNPNTITFGRKPMFGWIFGWTTESGGGENTLNANHWFCFRRAEGAPGFASSQPTFNDNNISWYSTGARAQYNYLNTTYCYIFICE